MASAISKGYRSDLTRLFSRDVLESDYYLFVSSTSNTTVSNSNFSRNSFLEKTIFGKKITTDEVLYMIINHPWVINTVYDQYDDREDISSLRYYAVVYPENNETNDYKIYKCLFNNYGAESIYPPNYRPNTPNQIYTMGDGYVWKFMYSLSVSDFDKYSTIGYIPIMSATEEFILNPANTSVTSADITAPVEQVFVVNPDDNAGYEKVEGNILEVIKLEVGSGSNRKVYVDSITINSKISRSLNIIENYYSGYTIYATESSNTAVSSLATVDSYVYSSTTDRAVIRFNEEILLESGNTVLSTGIEVGSDFLMTPTVKVLGDGTGFSAIPNVNESGSITSIRVVDPGSGYTNAIAFVPDPFAFDPSAQGSLNQRVELRPVLSPPGGHASNLIDELSCRHVLAYTGITISDNAFIPTTNDFASIGIVKNPQFKELETPDIFDNRIAIALDSHTLSVNEFVTQIDTDVDRQDSDFFNQVRFRAKVHEIDGDVIYLCEYMGPYPNDIDGTSNPIYANTDFSDISLDINLPLLSPQNQILNINTDDTPEIPNGFSLSPYVQRTGEVYYMSDFSPITRSSTASEQFKILLEF